MNSNPHEDRYSRQQDVVPAERLADCRATVIGVGAIGRQVALQLTAMGIPWLQLVDFDSIETPNLASQGYLEGDLGYLKVEATAVLCRRINSEIEITTMPERFRRSMEIGNVVFCCVDRIDIRRLIWEAVKDSVSFFVDGRMSAEILRILSACDAESRQYYPSTLFRTEEAFVDLAPPRPRSTVPISRPGSWSPSSPSTCGLAYRVRHPNESTGFGAERRCLHTGQGLKGREGPAAPSLTFS